MEGQNLHFGETEQDELKRLPDLIDSYAGHFAAIVRLVEHVQQGADGDLTELFGQI